MLEITLYYYNGEVTAFEACGHAGFDSSGRDVACAGASAIILTCLLGLEKALKIGYGLEQNDGYTYFTLPCDLSPSRLKSARQLLDSMVLGLEEVSGRYPENMRIIKEEIGEDSDSTFNPNEGTVISEGEDLMPEETEPKVLVPEEESAKKSNPYTVEKLVGVSFLGALAGLLVYYAYNQLDETYRKQVKDTIFNTVKTQVRKLLAEPQ